MTRETWAEYKKNRRAHSKTVMAMAYFTTGRQQYVLCVSTRVSIDSIAFRLFLVIIHLKVPLWDDVYRFLCGIGLFGRPTSTVDESVDILHEITITTDMHAKWTKENCVDTYFRQKFRHIPLQCLAWRYNFYRLGHCAWKSVNQSSSNSYKKLSFFFEYLCEGARTNGVNWLQQFINDSLINMQRWNQHKNKYFVEKKNGDQNKKKRRPKYQASIWGEKKTIPFNTTSKACKMCLKRKEVVEDVSWSLLKILYMPNSPLSVRETGSRPNLVEGDRQTTVDASKNLLCDVYYNEIIIGVMHKSDAMKWLIVHLKH